MKLTQKLLGYLHRVFDKDPRSFLALRLRYAGTSMTWDVSDNVLTTLVVGGLGSGLSVDLSGYTVSSLVNYLAAQPGYTVEYADGSELSGLSAKVLIDGSGDQDASNGDHLNGYTSLLWAFLDPFAAELKEADHQVDEALNQMNMRIAEAEWLDEWGGYYGISRKLGELDSAYSRRIILEVMRPRGNNIAIGEMAGEILGQPVTVSDVRLWGPAAPMYNGANTHNSTVQHIAAAVPIYGLFDVNYVYNLESGLDVSEYAIQLASIVETVRDAGTHLRAMNLASSKLSDTAGLSPSDSVDLLITTGVIYNSAVNFNGAVTYIGLTTTGESLS